MYQSMSIPPSPQSVYYFQVICEQGNLTRAAERLGVTQPSLSLSLKRLEEQLDCQLIIRERKGLHPTKAGEALLDRSSELIHQWQGLREYIRGHEKEVSGPFHLGLHPAVGSYTLPFFIPELIRAFPQLQLNMSHGPSRQITADVISQKLDMGLVINPVPHPDLVMRPLLYDSVKFWRAKKVNPKNDPNSEECVLFCDQQLLQSQSLLKKIKRKNLFKKRIHLSSLENIARITAKGTGVGIVPERVVGALGLDKNLKEISEFGSFKDELSLINHVNQSSLKSVQEVSKLIKHVLKGT